jgi:5'-3' exonuclease
VAAGRGAVAREMGIQGLLPHLRGITVARHLSEFRGQRAAVDTFGWLHRGCHHHATAVVREGDFSAVVRFCLRRVDLLLLHGVEPLLVFDGSPLPLKAGTEEVRRASRELHRAEADRLFAEGRAAEAEDEYARAVDVTSAMARALQVELRRRGVPFLVAPFEADAQLGYLAKAGRVQLVVSEDSDCLAFGCPFVLFKLDAEGGCESIDLRHLDSCPGFKGIGADAFLNLCILSGCDYLPSLNGMGVVTAAKYVRKYRLTERLLRGLHFESKFLMPNWYDAEFYKARLTFRHQRIFASEDSVPRVRFLEPLNPDSLLLLPLHERDPASFLGPELDDATGRALALGELDPLTLEPFAGWDQTASASATRASTLTPTRIAVPPDTASECAHVRTVGLPAPVPSCLTSSSKPHEQEQGRQQPLCFRRAAARAAPASGDSRQCSHSKLFIGDTPAVPSHTAANSSSSSSSSKEQHRHHSVATTATDTTQVMGAKAMRDQRFAQRPIAILPFVAPRLSKRTGQTQEPHESRGHHASPAVGVACAPAPELACTIAASSSTSVSSLRGEAGSPDAKRVCGRERVSRLSSVSQHESDITSSEVPSSSPIALGGAMAAGLTSPTAEPLDTVSSISSVRPAEPPYAVSSVFSARSTAPHGSANSIFKRSLAQSGSPLRGRDKENGAGCHALQAAPLASTPASSHKPQPPRRRVSLDSETGVVSSANAFAAFAFSGGGGSSGGATSSGRLGVALNGSPIVPLQRRTS